MPLVSNGSIDDFQVDLRSIIGHGLNPDSSEWFVVSDRSRKTGQQYKGSGQKVTIKKENYCERCQSPACDHLDMASSLVKLPINLAATFPWLKMGDLEYSCSCVDFRRSREDCVHINSLKYFQEEIQEKKEDILPKKEEEINSLKEKVQGLESTISVYSSEKETLQGQIKDLETKLVTADAQARQALEKQISQLKGTYDHILDDLKSAFEDKKATVAHLEDEKAEYRETMDILEAEKSELKQKLDAERQAKEKAQIVAESLSKTRFAGLYNLPKDVQSIILSLADLAPEKIKEVLSPVIYLQIPASEKDYREKIGPEFYNHHRPQHFLEFMERLAKINTVDKLVLSNSGLAKETSLKKTYSPGELMPCNEKASAWTIHLVYSNEGFASNLYLKTTARNKEEAESIAKVVQEKL